MGNACHCSTQEDRSLLNLDQKVAVVLCGPVVGAVTDTSANLLLELDRDAEVTCIATALSYGDQEVEVRVRLFKEDPGVIMLRGLTPTTTYRISQELEMQGAKCLQEAYRQTWSFPATSLTLEQTSNLMMWSDNDVLNDFNTADYRMYQRQLWDPNCGGIEDQKEVEEWHFHKYGAIGIFMLDLRGNRTRERCNSKAAASAARDVLLLGGDLHVSIYSVIYDKVLENSIRCLTTSPVSNTVARFYANQEGEINSRRSGGLSGLLLLRKISGVQSISVLEELVLCPICMQPIYKCVALMPCSHSFCMSCCSDWIRRDAESAQCPLCRRRITAVMKNHPMDSVVEAYLVARPDRRRPKEELLDMDSRDKLRQKERGSN
eukprot:g33515.t1